MQVRHYRTQGWPGLSDVRKWLGLVIIHGHKNGYGAILGNSHSMESLLHIFVLVV